jgi:hypothetical protein
MAVEGMHLEHGRDVLVADTGQQFADAIVRLYSDESLWISISDAALMNVQRHFSPDVAARSLERLLALAATGKRNDRTRCNFATRKNCFRIMSEVRKALATPPATFERVARNQFIRGSV